MRGRVRWECAPPLHDSGGEVHRPVTVEKLAQGEAPVSFLYSPPQLAGLTLREMNRVELLLVPAVPGRSVHEPLAERF